MNLIFSSDSYASSNENEDINLAVLNKFVNFYFKNSLNKLTCLGYFVLLEGSMQIFQTFRVLGFHPETLEERLTLGNNLAWKKV